MKAELTLLRETEKVVVGGSRITRPKAKLTMTLRREILKVRPPEVTKFRTRRSSCHCEKECLWPQKAKLSFWRETYKIGPPKVAEC